MADNELLAWQKARKKPASEAELLRRHTNKLNNAQGQHFEREILAGCRNYAELKIAVIDKTPEPFRVISKRENGIFTGRFSTPAQPDFQGTLHGGHSVVFEAKRTNKDRIMQNVLTETQMEVLESHNRQGALCGICICIQDEYFFIPWNVWRDMKEIYGRKYVTKADVQEHKVKFDGAVHFLEKVIKEEEGFWEWAKKI